MIWEVFIILCSLAASGKAAEYCLTDGGSSLSYCEYQCCGDSPNHYCCGIYWWIIVAAVVGGVIFLTCVGGLIFCCVAASQGGGNKGRVVQPAPGNTTITTLGYTPGVQPGVQPNYGFNQPQPPIRNPAYNQYPPVYQPHVPAPSYDAVYPPPSTSNNPPPPLTSNHPPPTAASSRSSSASSCDSPKKNKRK